MLTDKQSLILCSSVGLGFSIAGMLDLLENYAISGIMIVLFIIILVNIFITLKKHNKKKDNQSS